MRSGYQFLGWLPPCSVTVCPGPSRTPGLSSRQKALTRASLQVLATAPGLPCHSPRYHTTPRVPLRRAHFGGNPFITLSQLPRAHYARSRDPAHRLPSRPCLRLSVPHWTVQSEKSATLTSGSAPVQSSSTVFAEWVSEDGRAAVPWRGHGQRAGSEVKSTGKAQVQQWQRPPGTEALKS